MPTVADAFAQMIEAQAAFHSKPSMETLNAFMKVYNTLQKAIEAAQKPA